MSPDLNSLILSGYEKLTDNGFASPVYTKTSKGNFRYRGLSQLGADYEYRIIGFQEIETNSTYFDVPEKLQVTKRVSNIWADVFIWNDEIYVGSRRQISQALEGLWGQIKKTYPLTMLDLIEDVKLRDQYGLIHNALESLSSRYNEEKALDWMSGIFVRNELIKSYKVTLLNLNATKREMDSINRIEVERSGAEISVLVPALLAKYQINPAKLPRVSYAISSLKKSILGLSFRPEAHSNVPQAKNFIDLGNTLPTYEPNLSPSIFVLGVGGSGGNAVNSMIASGLPGVEYLVVNTDKQALKLSKAKRKLLIGLGSTKGLGAGLQPEIGEQAANESLAEILNYIDGADMVFLVGGMGGGTATGAMGVIARAAREHDILTVACITTPFTFEGKRRKKIAEEGARKLFTHVDSLITIPNQNLFRVATDETTMSDAFDMADEVLYATIQMMTDLMVVPGLINIDFSDIRTLIEDMGNAAIGIGVADGDGRALEAAKQAMTNPLLDDFSIYSAKGVLINITGGRDLTLYEVDEAAQYIRRHVNQNTNIIVGSALDESLDNAIRVSVLATGVHHYSSHLDEPPSEVPLLVPEGHISSGTMIDKMCKWPIGDPSTNDFRFCGRETKNKDEPYCNAHSKVSYQPSRRKVDTKNIIKPFKQRNG